MCLDPGSVSGENETSDTDDETTNSCSTSVPVGPRTFHVTIGGTKVINSKEEKEDGNDNDNPQLFSQVQKRISRSGRTIYHRQLCQNEH